MNKEFDSEISDFFKAYQDRGMKKWAGYYLSDHVAKLTKDAKKRQHVNLKRKEMTQKEIGEVLLKAYSNHYRIKIQLKDIDKEGNYFEDIEGFVAGYQEDQLIINESVINIEDINNILLQN